MSGCRNYCKGCFQPETWDFDHGKPFTEETELRLLRLLAPSYINGLSVLGGEPFEPENQETLVPALRRIRERYPQKTIWVYTGCIYEQIVRPGSRVNCRYTESLLKCVDVLVDGPFVEERKDISLVFRGSANQRILDVKKTRETGKAVLYDQGGLRGVREGGNRR